MDFLMGELSFLCKEANWEEENISEGFSKKDREKFKKVEDWISGFCRKQGLPMLRVDFYEFYKEVSVGEMVKDFNLLLSSSASRDHFFGVEDSTVAAVYKSTGHKDSDRIEIYNMGNYKLFSVIDDAADLYLTYEVAHELAHHWQQHKHSKKERWDWDSGLDKKTGAFSYQKVVHYKKFWDDAIWIMSKMYKGVFKKSYPKILLDKIEDPKKWSELLYSYLAKGMKNKSKLYKLSKTVGFGLKVVEEVIGGVLFKLRKAYKNQLWRVMDKTKHREFSDADKKGNYSKLIRDKSDRLGDFFDRMAKTDPERAMKVASSILHQRRGDVLGKKYDKWAKGKNIKSYKSYY